MNYIDPSGHWNEKLGFNYVINEYKNQWAIASTKGERDYWANQADILRNQIRASGKYLESDIMLSKDKMIPMDQIMKQAHTMFPVLSAIQGFTEGAAQYIENHPGEGFAVSAMSFSAFGKISKLEKGLNFAVKPAEHMANAARFVPVQTLTSAIKYGAKAADPRGSNAQMFYTIMYKNGKAYNLEVLYEKATNTIFHFEYTRKAIGPLEAIPK